MTVRTLEIRAPGTGEIITTVPVQDEAAARRAVAEARTAQRAWSRASLRERARRTAALAGVLPWA